MTKVKKRPGPVAQSAFRSGLLAAIVAWFAGLGALYWFDMVRPVLAGYMLVVLFPVYLVLVAAALNVWLGYGKDATDLQPVYRSKDQ